MARVRFQKPDVTRLHLSDDDWIEVKTRLSGGERRRMSAEAFTDVSTNGGGPKGGTKIGVNFATLSLARTAAYLVDWSFRDDTGRTRKVSREAIEALDEETLNEIEDALDKHVEATEQEKKLTNPAGETPSSPA